MELKDVDILPGVVAFVNDPKNAGRIKAYIPTIFDPDTPIDALPWIYPFSMTGYQSYSRMRNGANIWVINNKKNYNEYWYLPFFRLNTDTQEIANQGTDVDILIDRNNGDSNVQIYYTPNEGIVKKVGENYTYLKHDGEYKLHGSGDIELVAKSGKISLGTNGGEETNAVRFDKLVEAISKFCEEIQPAVDVFANSPFISSAQGIFNLALQKLNNRIQQTKSDTVFIKG